MKYKTILLTGGAGFVGSSLSLQLKALYPDIRIYAFDNLRRRGSELNVLRLKEAGVDFVYGDVRQRTDLASLKDIDLVIECSAEPSVLAGYQDDPNYVIDTNLGGVLNCLELARLNKSDFVFLSTSRVYPIEKLNGLRYHEEATRFELTDGQEIPGVSKEGISEEFSLSGYRSIYGTTKLAAELMILEYVHAYNIKAVINRCGVIAGPWQMGKVDQGFVALWVAQHVNKKKLRYIGFEGNGKQVRDVLHVDDLVAAVDIQLRQMDKLQGQVFNIGGGASNAVSLCELTALCEKITGSKLVVEKVVETRPVDIKYYVSDCRKFMGLTGWHPRKNVTQIVSDVNTWFAQMPGNTLGDG